MRRGEAGFTLLELVVTVGILVILLAAGGVWMLGMRPAALRGALDDFDANLAAAKAIAATSGNGATLIFEPQTNGASGYTLSVYSGRPTAAGAVTATNTMIGNSAAAVSEAHFGSPPFAIFLSSAGYPTGKAGYPTVSGGVPSFTTIATEPPCPAGGIELTFTSPQGITATRTLPCNVVVSGTGGTDPTPSPNPLKVEPTYLLAHYTTDSGPLKFKAIEYGYYHWIDSLVGRGCSGGSSDTGAAPAVFPSPWPYAQPSPSSQGSLAPAPPSAPYTWPGGDPNDPPALFALSPVLHDGGMCTVTVGDDNGQSGSVQVQVMGDLTPSATTIPALNVGQSYTINFSKTFDSEQLVLYAGGPCQGIITATPTSGSFPATPSHTTANASVQIVGQTPGTCDLIVQDQYGEQIAFGVTVQQQIATWPQQLVLGSAGNGVGLTSGSAPIALDKTTQFDVAVGPLINALLAGGVARAYGPAGQICNALGVTNGFVQGDNPSGYLDTSLPASVGSTLGVYLDSDGCLVDANDNPLTIVGAIAYNPNGTTVTYDVTSPCNGTYVTTWWQTNPNAAQSLMGASGNSAGSCNVDIAASGDSARLAPDAGLVGITVINPDYFTVECTGFVDQEGDRGCGVACEGDSIGCQSVGQSIEFLCAGSIQSTNSSGLFTITTGEGTSQPDYSIGPNQEAEISTSSDGTAFIQSGSC